MIFRVWQFRVSRLAGRIITRVAAFLTLERMPPFVSTSAIVVDGGQILAIIDPRHRKPVLPGGHLKWREKPEEALVREVREETGYTIWTSELFGAFAADECSDEPGVVRLIYEGTIQTGDLRSSPEGEAVWMPVSRFASSDSRDASLAQRWLSQRK